MTLFITHPACLEHLNPPGHPERPERLRAIEQEMEREKFMFLLREQCPKAGLANDRPVPPAGIRRADSQGGAADLARPARR